MKRFIFTMIILIMAASEVNACCLCRLFHRRHKNGCQQQVTPTPQIPYYPPTTYVPPVVPTKVIPTTVVPTPTTVVPTPTTVVPTPTPATTLPQVVTPPSPKN
jgi:hypothetical protein